MFSKQGVLLVENRLYYALFIFKKVFYKRNISLENLTDISVISFSAKTKTTYSFLSFLTFPSMAPTTEYQEIYLLNKNHTQKVFVVSSKKRDLIEKAVLELSVTLDFKIKPYSPPRSKRRRR